MLILLGPNFEQVGNAGRAGAGNAGAVGDSGVRNGVVMEFNPLRRFGKNVEDKGCYFQSVYF